MKGVGFMIKRGNGFIDMTGVDFNGCRVVRLAESNGKKARWECICFCGKPFEVLGTSIRNNNTKSCGCLRSKKGKEINTTHGGSNTRLYHIWNNMKSRCLNPNNEAYNRYGGRGIKIQQSWIDNFSEFRKWSLNNGYSDELTIDRIDNDGNYEEGNCKWSNYYEQGRNKRNNAMSYYKGKMRSRAEISELTGLSYGTIRRREQSGIDFDKPLRIHKDGKYLYPESESSDNDSNHRWFSRSKDR